jgi:hypothetical protein
MLIKWLRRELWKAWKINRIVKSLINRGIATPVLSKEEYSLYVNSLFDWLVFCCLMMLLQISLNVAL